MRPFVTVTVVACAIVAAALGLIEDPLQARAVLIAGLYLTFALSEIVAPFVPTLFLLVTAPLLLGPLSQNYALGNVLRWAADPVLALFAGGLALGIAAQRHGVDAALAALLLRAAGRSKRGLLAVTLLAATFLSMWLSNVAAAALLLAALRPALASIEPGFRRGLLVALAMGANLGGVTTPIGSGPNAIAIAETRAVHPIEFAEWMGFGVPIAAGMGAIAYAWLVLRYRVTGPSELQLAPPEALTRRGYGVLLLLAAAIIAWLSEPLHGIAAPSIALALMLALFGSSLLNKADLGALDWSTLGLIAGGLVLGRLLESSGILAALAHAVPIGDAPRWLWLGALVGFSALLSALMSNTATAAMLIPLGMQIDGAASTAVIIAVATSFGMPLPISTPPNALIYGTGMIRSRDLLEIGLGLMLIGCLVVTLSGSWFLGFFGLR